MPNRLTTEQFIKRAKLKHGDKYDYSQSIYVNSLTPIEIICPIHGLFIQSPVTHLRGCECRECGNQSLSKVLRSNINEFVIKAQLIHKNKYNYDEAEYINNRTKLIIICPAHGSFFQTPSNHLKGQGCYECGKTNDIGWSRTGFINKYQDKLCTFYILKCWNKNERFIKIGITGKSIKNRFKYNNLPYDYAIIKTIINEPGRIWDIEQGIKYNREYTKYIPKLDFSGKTECFTLDTLNRLAYAHD